MKIMEGMRLCPVADQFLVVAYGKASEKLQNMIRINDTGKVIWDCIEKGMDVDEIAATFAETYEDISLDEARKDVEETISLLMSYGIVSDEDR